MSSDKIHIPTIDDLIEIPQPVDVQIAPNGSQVAYAVRRPDWKTNEFITQIWLANAESGAEPRQLTYAAAGSHSPRWSADGRWLAFLSQRADDEQTQIYRLSADGGEAERLTEMPTAVRQIAWSPDGRFIAFTAANPESDVDAKRKEQFGDYQVEDEDYNWIHLWLLDLEQQKWRKLTGGHSFHVLSFRWSPDSSRLAFDGAPTPNIADWDLSRIYTVTLEALAVTPLSPSGHMSPRWSPDGTQIACVHVGDAYYKNNKPVLLDATNGTALRIPIEFDENLSLLDWKEPGIMFTALQRASLHLFCLQPDDGTINQLTPAGVHGWVSQQATFSSDGRQAALIAADDAHVNEVALLELAEGAITRLTQFQKTVADWQLTCSATLQWTSHDGTEIEGVLTKPVDFDPEQKYPLLVVVHGGPSWASFPTLIARHAYRMYPIPLWAAKGALILQPNYRGSTGYGQAFRSLNVRNMGIGDYEDVISGVDALIERGWVDRERVGVMGWSQGGYISMFITTYSDRFTAVSAGAGISNWMTYYVNTDIHPFTRHYLQATPWDDETIYKQTSPMTYVSRANTPTLIQHGRSDARVPLPNAYELYQGLRDVGVEVKLVTYPGMPHGPEKPRQCRSLMQDNLDWFNRWIWGEAPQQAGKTQCYIVMATTEQAENAAALPALQRYSAPSVQDIYHQARRDDTDFRILSAQQGLLTTESPALPDPHPEVTVDGVAALALQLAETIKAAGWEEIVLFLEPVDKRPLGLISLGCLQIAAGLAGGPTVRLEEMEPGNP